MRITSIESRILGYDIGEIWLPEGPPEGISSTFYRYSFDTFHTDEGIDGYTMQNSNLEDGAAMGQVLHDVYAPQLIGEDPLRGEALWQKLRRLNRHAYNLSDGVAGSIDVALWDIRGKVANQPIAVLLGLARDKIPAYATARTQNPTPEMVFKEAQLRRSEGYHGFKIQFWDGLERDIPRFRAAREAVGPDYPLMQDAAGMYTFAQALAAGRVLGELNYEWFEEPIPDRNLFQLKRLTDELSAPILAGETSRVHELAEGMRMGAFDIARGDVHLKEGITGLHKAVGMADLLGFDLEVHGVAQPLLEAANLHVSLAMQNGRWAETFNPQYGLGVKNNALGIDAQGYKHLPPGPGLGVELDWDWIDKVTQSVISDAGQMSGSLLLRGVRVVDGRGVREPRADVLIEDGRISRISAKALTSRRATVHDLDGRTICPGLMNAHSHICLDGTSPDPEAILRVETPAENAVRSAGRLRKVLASGVTAIRDVGAPWGVDIALKRLVDRGEIPGPRMITAGRNITMTGGHGHWMGLEADGPEGVRHAARTQIKAGATAIKVMATGGMMTPNQVAGAPQFTVEEMRAACEEAHKAGFPVAAHSESDQGTRNAVLAGVDSIEHGHGATVETLQLMLDRGTALVPTILSDRRIIEAPPGSGIPDFVIDKCVPLGDALIETLHNAFRMGVTIAAGNDGGAPLVEIGEMAEELELYVTHGLSPQAALAAGTINTARLFRLAEVGYLEPGWHADLLVLDGDPLSAVRALRRPAMVIKGGEVVAGVGGGPKS